MPMNMLIFDDVALAQQLKAAGVAVMRQPFGLDAKYVVADTPEIREKIQKNHEHFDWSAIGRTSHLCF